MVFGTSCPIVVRRDGSWDEPAGVTNFGRMSALLMLWLVLLRLFSRDSSLYDLSLVRIRSFLFSTCLILFLSYSNSLWRLLIRRFLSFPSFLGSGLRSGTTFSRGFRMGFYRLSLSSSSYKVTSLVWRGSGSRCLLPADSLRIAILYFKLIQFSDAPKYDESKVATILC